MRAPLLVLLLMLCAVCAPPAHAQAGIPAAAACAACHGQRGEGNAAVNGPRLAGQSETYLARQLRYFADGSRTNAVMTPIAQGLNPDQVLVLAAYYAGLAAPPAKAAAGDSSVLRRGEQLATVGDESLMVQACANCHGPGGRGLPPFAPYLSGQSGAYLASSLAAWKSGARKTDPSLQMSHIGQQLRERDIDALALYFSTQPAPVLPSRPHP